MNIGDKINIAVAFDNKDNIIEKYKIFVFNDIEIVDVIHSCIAFITEKIKDIPYNQMKLNNDKFIIEKGYEFVVDPDKINQLDYDRYLNAYCLISNTMCGEELKHNLIQSILNGQYEELERLKQKIIKLEQSINSLVKL